MGAYIVESYKLDEGHLFILLTCNSGECYHRYIFSLTTSINSSNSHIVRNTSNFLVIIIINKRNAVRHYNDIPRFVMINV